MPIIQTKFDYSVVSPQIAEVLQDHAARIREKNVEVREMIIQIGRYLLAAKRCLPHGRFEQWVAEECNFTTPTAQAYMNVADFWIDNHGVVKSLPPSAVYAVAAPRLSKAVREKVLAAVRAGDCRTLEDVKVRISNKEVLSAPWTVCTTKRGLSAHHFTGLPRSTTCQI